MPKISRNFTKGRMNKSVDQKLVPDGEYIHAENIVPGNSDQDNMGVLGNIKGNLQLSGLQFDGTPLSANARTIGKYADGATETVYWMVHDPTFPLGATGKLDIIASYDEGRARLIYHVISIRNGSTLDTTLDFDPAYLINGINLIDDFLIFNDAINQMRCINVKRSYPIPTTPGYVDQITAEQLLLIKQRPINSPEISLIRSPGQENFMTERLICFAYRYKYEDDEYSATSQFSAPAFLPKTFDFSISSFVNEGMTNFANACIITYNSGGPLVKGIDILFKEADDNIIKVIEKVDKKKNGIADNSEEQYVFSKRKIFTILPDYEILRLYDNVPLRAVGQTLMGNRVMAANYIEGYDMLSAGDQPVRLTYEAEIISEIIGLEEPLISLINGNYNIDGAEVIAESVIRMDFTGIDLVEGALLSVEITVDHDSFSGSLPAPTDITEDVNIVFSFFLPRDFASAYAMATSTEFQEVVGTVVNILPVYDPALGPTSCSGVTFTDLLNCAIPNTLDAYIKIESGIDTPAQPIAIIITPAEPDIIKLQLVAMKYVDDLVTPTGDVFEYYKITASEASYQAVGDTRSLHSNRGYEAGIVYMDGFGRSSTALVSPNNTVHVPCSSSPLKNSLRITIPGTQKGPVWADRYKFVIKPDRETYETIYSNIFFPDPTSNAAYFLLEGENMRKVEAGDRLIVKADTNGATRTCVFTTVLETESQAEGFIEIPSVLNPAVNIPVPAGVYMKMNPNNFNVQYDELSLYAPGPYTVVEDDGGDFPINDYNVNRVTTPGVYVDFDIPAGSRIKLKFSFERKGTGDGNNKCERRIYNLEKTLIASASYDNFKDWWDGDHVELILNDGQAVVGDGGTILNEYISSMALGLTDIPTTTGVNYYRFYRDAVTNKLDLLITGTQRCTGVFAKENRRSSVTVDIQVFRADSTIIFETMPSDALPDVFYESSLSFGIDANGQHLGNVQDQNFATGDPAIIDTDFFNCFSFGNGAESYKIRDSVSGKAFRLGNRAMSVSDQEFKETHRFSDITYSGVYNDNTNVNRLNEFNLGLLNFKHLEDSFGPIQVIDGRKNDVLVLQEDKISYVLVGKNLLSDSEGGGTLTSIPEVLGEQIPRTENYGISFHPESYVVRGAERYFTDAKRGAVLRLVGGSFQNDQLEIISEAGMMPWFRDLFNSAFLTQKLGGYDPYRHTYVLCSNEEQVPAIEECIDCGVPVSFTLPGVIDIEYCIGLGAPVGVVIVTYNIISIDAGETINVTNTYNGADTSSGDVDVSGQYEFNKNVITENTTVVTVTGTGNAVVEVTLQCPAAETITIIEICLTNDEESGLFIHNEFRYSAGAFEGPTKSALVQFVPGSTLPLVSRYYPSSGLQGSAFVPTTGSDVRLIANKFGFDDFDFDPAADKFRYLRTGTLYGNNTTDLQSMLSLSAEATPIFVDGNQSYAEFIMPGGGQYLYLIWDYRNSIPVDLCYSNVSKEDVCCNC